MGMILVTHNFGVVADICDTVSVMSAGRIVETGPVHDLFDHPEHPYTQSLFDAVLEEMEPAVPLTVAPPRHAATRRSPPVSERLVDIRDLVVEYPAKGFRKKPFRALKGVSIDIDAGETVGLGGRIRVREDHARACRCSGSPPSTGGTITYDGRDIGAAFPRSSGARSATRSRSSSRTRTPR